LLDKHDYHRGYDVKDRNPEPRDGIAKGWEGEFREDDEREIEVEGNVKYGNGPVDMICAISVEVRVSGTGRGTRRGSNAQNGKQPRTTSPFFSFASYGLKGCVAFQCAAACSTLAMTAM
jgi:hypothetical protein